MASFHKSLCIFFLLFSTLLYFSNAFNLTVGGNDGWTLHPTESYSQWSGRLRFNVNDTLHFKYNGKSDSVMEVNKANYDTCNTNNSITTLTGGDSFFILNRPGPFYFISGNKSSCNQGQKVTVVVVSPRKKQTPPTLASAPASFIPVPTAVSTPLESEGSPVAASDGTASSSPTANPGSVNAPAPSGSVAAKPAVCATWSVLLAMIIFRLGWVY
ncbi:early nodulin-like protein 2 [Bidens hawaiensis]|uniref:early nodulin-like protein 2 n=1 Tax=Bidens hawaiensis TaxID=980011 RepID=UPI004049AEED